MGVGVGGARPAAVLGLYIAGAGVGTAGNLSSSVIANGVRVRDGTGVSDLHNDLVDSWELAIPKPAFSRLLFNFCNWFNFDVSIFKAAMPEDCDFFKFASAIISAKLFEFSVPEILRF